MKFESDSIDSFADSRPISDCKSVSDLSCLLTLCALSVIETEFSISCRYSIPLSSFSVGFVSVDLYGRVSSSSYNSLTSEITSILNEELSIEPDKIYVKYSEIENWGWNGNNF